MLNGVVTISLFVAAGIGWRLAKPQGITAEVLLRQLTALTHMVILPAAVFITISRLPLNEAALRILLYVLATTAITLAIAWLWLRTSKLPPKTKGALLIAAGFGNVLFLGIPMNKLFVADWSTRVAVEYGLVENVLLLFTLGAILSRSLLESGKGKLSRTISSSLKDYDLWLKEPLVWAALAGLALNLVGVDVPAWLRDIEITLYGILIPLLILSTALALNWTEAWKQQWVNVLPVAAIQLIAVPLLMWGTVSLFGPAGVKGTQALLIDSMLPASVLGFAFCERYKLDTGAYALAFTVTTVLSVITVPVWFNILL